MDVQYRLRGGMPLQGEVHISGSKNAVLPLLAASVLSDGEMVLQNVPRIRDVEAMLRILEYLGAATSFSPEGTVRVRTDRLRSKPIPEELVSRLRGSIVLLGPLLARFGIVEMAYPGGCVLGKRPIHAHIAGLEQLGARSMGNETMLHLQGTLQSQRVVLPEFSVTATENVLLAAALLPGETRIDLAACEPHVQDLQRLLSTMGAHIEGMGTHTVFVRGKTTLQGVCHRVAPDYLEAGVFVIAGLVTKGKVRLKGVEYEHLLAFLDVLRRCGGVWKYDDQEKTLFVDGELSSLRAMNIRTNIYPGFPTDLQAPMGVAMTQAKGVSRLFERMYEGRLAYLYELEKMGAHVEVLNAHQALIIGPTPLKGRVVASNDIRAGAAMVLAALSAEGETTVTDVRYIERGYDRLDEKLRALGARIERVTVGEQERREITQKAITRAVVGTV
ncbi:UDP-N-acetylglucosamine 1-carboxyvinyltransferase [Candidatus Peribacteria bacterium RIFCSPLOWO2_12_FULL_55_15]|nr:MAG: UDP-N-acetylglucosamine 1-carboxyvinyltransferase [Candidatus Peribacteria bacterium RIFCSPHIGHO2_01_FULL_54_22]OGJ63258.1 MAG: UDP-N-acetylglucosamine 1-carboxyvinyltransferase [Candidatus Peribacteria bacterium RIFCSPHIGHO2_02_FULL_55_24]OGJ63780.1 MAG: UDP-N-acetylglucosamine 1-carboxyvinyltransferase [Candidatus Peribacteria bacterium RIFCSPHIGHO2_12_FULL_54_10]OGJ70117.1 MAG: UDP-N-acetylglucosamine 1-carboxyvinyltransferase [Candidatus Peribacteria bacterium RIFCSPLOWO2_02_FULL_55_